jgi:hypothetical protein
MYNALLEEFENDEITEHMKEHITGLATDGAANMRGKINGLAAYMKKFAKNPIFTIHCLAHRLQLALSHATKEVEYFELFENVINGIHNFYMSRSHKRFNHLKKEALELGEKIFSLNYIFKIRWVASELQAIKKIRSMWYVITFDLDDISHDPEFDQNTKDLAAKYLKVFTDKNFVIILHFIIDILEDLNRYSLIFQQRGGSVIGKESLKQKMLESIRTLKNNQGSILNTYLNEVNCTGFLKCDLEIYEKSIVNWHGIFLLETGKVPKLTSIRQTLLNALEAELNIYFPDSELQNYDIFLPENIPQDTSQLETYGQVEIGKIAKFFGLDGDLLKRDWLILLNKLLSDPDVRCAVSNQPPHIFWPYILKNINGIPESMIKMMRKILSLPIGNFY